MLGRDLKIWIDWSSLVFDGRIGLMDTSGLNWWFSGFGSWLACMVPSCPLAHSGVAVFF